MGKNPFGKLYHKHELTVPLSWSVCVMGRGDTIAEARHNLMADALGRLKEPSLRRVENALNTPEEANSNA